ncbi:MAG: hypothetical protein HQ494_13910 [Rhodospirillales bacterium]|nr:hypothetical protein [Rhodospirillales bacterium]
MLLGEVIVKKSGWLIQQVEQAKNQVENLSEWKQQAILHEVEASSSRKSQYNQHHGSRIISNTSKNSKKIA